MRSRSRATRVLILTAAVGDGHLTAARVLEDQLVATGRELEIEVADALEALGRPLRVLLLDMYRWQIRRASWIFGVLYGLFVRIRPLRAGGARNIALLGARSLHAFVARRAPDVVVSTYPAATAALGHLRRSGRLDVPAYATITDLDGISFWAHPGIDLHLVMHDACVPEVERVAGAGSARCVRPLVSAPFYDPAPMQRARRALELPETGRVVAVSGGGWGVGRLEEAIRVALELPDATVVALAGRDPGVQGRLEQAFGQEPRVRVLGFTDRMPDLLAAVDVLVHSTGGVTCLEALVCGCPVVAFGAPPGHARLTARRMDELGLGRNAPTADALRGALAAALAEPRPAPYGRSGAGTAADVVLSGAERSGRRERRSAPRRLGLALATTTTALLASVLVVANDAAYPFAARMLEIEPLSSVQTAQPVVGVVVAGGPAGSLAAAVALERAGAHGSFGFVASPGRRDLTAIRSDGDEALPELAPGGLTGWLGADDQIRARAQMLGAARGRLYLPPSDGFSLGEQLVADTSGRRPVAAAVAYGPALPRSHRLRAGDVVALDLPAGAGEKETRGIVAAFLADARRAGLRPVTLSSLLADRSP